MRAELRPGLCGAVPKPSTTANAQDALSTSWSSAPVPACGGKLIHVSDGRMRGQSHRPAFWGAKAWSGEKGMRYSTLWARCATSILCFAPLSRAHPDLHTSCPHGERPQGHFSLWCSFQFHTLCWLCHQKICLNLILILFIFSPWLRLRVLSLESPAPQTSNGSPRLFFPHSLLDLALFLSPLSRPSATAPFTDVPISSFLSIS